MKASALLLICLLCSLTSCVYNDTTVRIPSSQYFPNAVGNVWVYNVYDSLEHASYDVTVKVEASVLINGRAMNLWKFIYPDQVDTNYLNVKHDTIIFLSRNKVTVKDTYVLPLDVGSKWDGAWIYDNYTVNQQSNAIVYGQTFDGAFNIGENAISPNYRKVKDEWFVPNIGMIRRYQFEYNLGPPTSRSWYLKSWKL